MLEQELPSWAIILRDLLEEVEKEREARREEPQNPCLLSLHQRPPTSNTPPKEVR